MSNPHDNRTTETDLAWLKNDDPEIFHLLRALDGDLDALRWLKLHGDGLFFLVEALTGAREALETLQAQPVEKLVDVIDTIKHCDVDDWLRENHAELHSLFAYVRGEDGALRGVERKKTTYKRVADILRAKFQAYHDEDADGIMAANGEEVPEDTAADVGCLIGEMHLQNHEYHKAIEAFSRAIANDPTPDAHAGRARAYRALAAQDDHSAAELRSRSAR